MKRILFYCILGMTTAGILGLCGLFGLYIYFSRDLPSITKIDDYRPKQVTTVYARDNSIMGYFFKEKRFLVNIDNIPKNVINAFLAAEDADFFDHPGISVKGIVRAAITNIREKESSSGGSTVTQQLVKQLLLTREKTYERKIKEAILSYKLEQSLTKDQILYLYLNHIYLGSSAYGVEAAARTYFGKHLDELTVAEAAALGALPKAPSTNNPYGKNKKDFLERQAWVVKRMYDLGYITQEEYQTASAEKLEFSMMEDPSWKLGAYYLEEVRRELLEFLKEENVKRLGIPLELYGEEAVYEAGLHVYTAMDPVHQAAAEASLRQGIRDGFNRSGWHGPVEHIAEENRDSFVKDMSFSPKDLDNAGWVKALVTAVKKDGASVRMGEYTGFIPLSAMNWARMPNPRQISGAVKINDATQALKAGDVVWVSAYGAEGSTNPVGVPATPKGASKGTSKYVASAQAKGSPIQLALEQMPKLQGAMASIEVHTGDLVALVGGYQFSSADQFNRATQAKRQPGSSFKPIVYSAAMDSGFTAGSIIMDTPFELYDPYSRKTWTPSNYDGKYLGPIPVRTALALSRNVCTVRVAQMVGMPKVVERARQLGIQGDIPAVLAVSLGSAEVTPLNLAEAYTAFANNGVAIKPRKLLAIANSWNEKIVDISADSYQAISPENAYIMASLLKDVVTAGTAGRARVLDRPVAGKTGTSNNERDTWFIGFSPYLVTSTWIGFDDNTPVGRGETGAKTALPPFVEYRKKIDVLYPPEDFVAPPGIVMVTVDAETGFLAGPGTSKSYTLPYIRGTEPSFVAGTPIDRGPQEVQSGEDIMKQMFF